MGRWRGPVGANGEGHGWSVAERALSDQPAQPPAKAAEPNDGFEGWICGNNYRRRGSVLRDEAGEPVRGVVSREPWYIADNGMKWSGFDVTFKSDAHQPAQAEPGETKKDWAGYVGAGTDCRDESSTANERERAARICEEYAVESNTSPREAYNHFNEGRQAAARELARRIRGGE